MENMTGEDLRLALTDTKKTASGLGQWKPADARMLSTVALGKLADMMNLIEEGAE